MVKGDHHHLLQIMVRQPASQTRGVLARSAWRHRDYASQRHRPTRTEGGSEPFLERGPHSAGGRLAEVKE